MTAHPPQPTESELAILQVLWQHGPSTVREVQEHLSEDEATGYTTVLKLLQIMHEKGLVMRDESQRAHIYEAAAPQEDTQQQLLDDLLDRAFGGSAEKLVMRALTSKRVSAGELEEIRALLDQLEEDQ